jgi:hypothetical protein
MMISGIPATVVPKPWEGSGKIGISQKTCQFLTCNSKLSGKKAPDFNFHFNFPRLGITAQS